MDEKQIDPGTDQRRLESHTMRQLARFRCAARRAIKIAKAEQRRNRHRHSAGKKRKRPALSAEC
jgi:hypothetical protein